MLARISALDLNAPAQTRADRIKQLRALPLKDPALVQTRDQCALAHVGLLAAELEQAKVKERVTAAEHGATRPDPSELESIASALTHATATLKESQDALPACMRATRALALQLR